MNEYINASVCYSYFLYVDDTVNYCRICSNQFCVNLLTLNNMHAQIKQFARFYWYYIIELKMARNLCLMHMVFRVH